MICKECGKQIVCECCGETENSQHVGDGHKFVPKECDHSKVCECGNAEFYAHQVCHLDVVVNGNNDWQRNSPDDNSACYESGTPFGPYTCTKCGKEYDDIHTS